MFVREGGYSHVTRSGDSQMFRFNSPSDTAFPRQVELKGLIARAYLQ